VNYGKVDFTQTNHVSGDRIFSDSDRNGRRRHGIVSVTPRFWGYIALLFVAFFATQALRSKASNIFISFVFFLPIALLLYTLTARLALSVHMMSDGKTLHKGKSYVYEMRMINQAPLAYPFIEAVMILPQSNSVRCTERSVYVSMTPFGKYDFQNEVSFRFRGTYHIGVDCFYVYDFFRIFRVRVDIQNAVTVLVLPRQLLLGENRSEAVSDEPDVSSRRTVSVDKVEIGDIRNYMRGDPLKSIHWNLSSRSEELIVKDYNSGSTKTTFVYCDLSAHFPEEAPVPPEPLKKDIRRAKREQKEEKKLLLRKKRAEKKAEKRGEPLSEEELRRLSMTKEMRRLALSEMREEQKRAQKLARIAELQKKNPQKAALERDRLYDLERVKKQGETQEEHTNEADLREEEAQLLKEDRFYEDMNEYCADAIIELSIATALRELRRGHEVVLVWYDRRSESGVCAYSFRSPVELQAIYSSFATAPLSGRDRFVGALSSLAGDTSGIRQIFVTAALDRETVSAYSSMAVGGGVSGGTEILLYNPDERFLYPARRRSYIEGCRDELAQRGILLTVDTPENKIAREVKSDAG
jgi:hypothetical protein